MTAAKHTQKSIRDPLTGRFISAKKPQIVEVKDTSKISSLFIIFALYVLFSLCAIILLIAANTRTCAEPTYIVVRDTFELSGSSVPPKIQTMLSEEPRPVVQSLPERREVSVFRNGQLSEVVTFD